jgi:hypothetical protein
MGTAWRTAPHYAAFLNNRARPCSDGNLTAADPITKALSWKRKSMVRMRLRLAQNLARLVYARNAGEGEKLFKEAVYLTARIPNLQRSIMPPRRLAKSSAKQRRPERGPGRCNTRRCSRKGRARSIRSMPPAARSGTGDQSARSMPVERRSRKPSRCQGNKERIIRIGVVPERLAAVYDEAGDYGAAEPCIGAASISRTALSTC